MQKIMLVSDYDGTLKSDIKNLKININAINKFREKGHLFVISTGRSYHSIKKECKKYEINYDYLFCNNGRVLFDYKDDIIYQKNFDNEILLEINSIIENHSGIKSIEYYNPYGKTDLVFNNSIIEIYLRLNILNMYPSLKKHIEDKYPDLKFSKCLIYASLKKKIDKSRGLQILADKLSDDILRENIITVGDNYNDLSMLKDFDGYRIQSSYPFLYGKGLKTTREVHTLIKKLEKRL